MLGEYTRVMAETRCRRTPSPFRPSGVRRWRQRRRKVNKGRIISYEIEDTDSTGIYTIGKEKRIVVNEYYGPRFLVAQRSPTFAIISINADIRINILKL